LGGGGGAAGTGVGTVERKKNPFDPLNNPVKLFRHGKTDADKVSLNAYKKKIEQ
jgi:hypothetical protein